MPKGIYIRKPLTDKHKRNLSLSLKGKNAREKNGNWGGDKVTYHSLHLWVRRNKGKAEICSICRSLENVEWASISHKAKRDLDDYLALCSKCHYKYDEMGKKAWITRRKKYGQSGSKRKLL